MHPDSSDALAGVLARRQWLPAATALLTGRLCRITFGRERSAIDPAEPDRARALHRQPSTPGTEMFHMSLMYPLADRHPLTHPDSTILAFAQPR
jgi:hypothetical protein